MMQSAGIVVNDVTVTWRNQSINNHGNSAHCSIPQQANALS